VNFIWQTITGLTQWQRFISAAVNPWSQRFGQPLEGYKRGIFQPGFFPVQKRDCVKVYR
jgi:hypothetical protein